MVGVPIYYEPEEDGGSTCVGAVFAACSFRMFGEYRTNLLQMFLLAAVAAFMVSFCIVWLYSYSMVRPLRDMASAARSSARATSPCACRFGGRRDRSACRRV